MRDWIKQELEATDFNDLPKEVEEFYKKDQKEDPENFEKKQSVVEDEAKKKGCSKKDTKKSGKGKKSDLDEFLDGKQVTGPSKIVEDIQKNIEKFKNIWMEEKVMKRELNNFEQKHDQELAMEMIKPQVEDEVKKLVDE